MESEGESSMVQMQKEFGEKFPARTRGLVCSIRATEGSGKIEAEEVESGSEEEEGGGGGAALWSSALWSFCGCCSESVSGSFLFIVFTSFFTSCA